jgi:hypothetical protein
MDAKIFEQLLNDEKSISKKIDELNETLKAIKVYKAHCESSGSGSDTATSIKPNSEFPDVYSNELNLNQAVYLALKRIQTGTSNEIAKSLMELDSAKFNNAEKTLAIARDKSSRLGIQKVFGAKKVSGKKGFCYFIK